LVSSEEIALRVGNAAESTDALHVLRLFGHVSALGAQLLMSEKSGGL